MASTARINPAMLAWAPQRIDVSAADLAQQMKKAVEAIDQASTAPQPQGHI